MYKMIIIVKVNSIFNPNNIEINIMSIDSQTVYSIQFQVQSSLNRFNCF